MSGTLGQKDVNGHIWLVANPNEPARRCYVCKLGAIACLVPRTNGYIRRTPLLKCQLCQLFRCPRWHHFPPCSSELPRERYEKYLWDKADREEEGPPKKRKKGARGETGSSQ